MPPPHTSWLIRTIASPGFVFPARKAVNGLAHLPAETRKPARFRLELAPNGIERGDTLHQARTVVDTLAFRLMDLRVHPGEGVFHRREQLFDRAADPLEQVNLAVESRHA